MKKRKTTGKKNGFYHVGESNQHKMMTGKVVSNCGYDGVIAQCMERGGNKEDKENNRKAYDDGNTADLVCPAFR